MTINYNNKTVLDLAQEVKNNEEVIEFLKKESKKFESRVKIFDPEAHLYKALNDNNLESLKFMFEKKNVKINHKFKDQKTALHLSIERNLFSFAEYLLKKNADVNTTDDQLTTPLHVAAEKSLPILRLLIAKGANVNARDHSKATPAHIAVKSSNLDTLKYLIQKANADVDSRDDEGWVNFQIEIKVLNLQEKYFIISF